jgi:uncharacterized phage protein (TIGR01671 family)
MKNKEQNGITKFRAWDEISNEVLGMKYNVVHNHNNTVMQSTDLFDKNNKEIYVGDIVEMNEHWERAVVIKLWNGCFATMQGNSLCKDWDEEEWNNCEIIGNIYENKELLK